MLSVYYYRFMTESKYAFNGPLGRLELSDLADRSKSYWYNRVFNSDRHD